MPQDIDGDDRQPILRVRILADILLVQVMRTQILAETKRLGRQPRLLQLYQDEMLLALVILYLGGEIHTEQRDMGPLHIRIFMLPDLQLQNLLLEQRGQQDISHPLVFHHILENGVINRIRYQCHIDSVFDSPQR